MGSRVDVEDVLVLLGLALLAVAIALLLGSAGLIGYAGAIMLAVGWQLLEQKRNRGQD